MALIFPEVKRSHWLTCTSVCDDWSLRDHNLLTTGVRSADEGRMYKCTRVTVKWGTVKGYCGRNNRSGVVFVCATGCRTVIYTVIGVQTENRVTLQQGALYLLSGRCSHQMEQRIPSLSWPPFSPGDLSRQWLCINGKALQWSKWSCPLQFCGLSGGPRDDTTLALCQDEI